MSLDDDDAARRALVSSGVVGLTTALLTKGFGVDLEVSLPVALATGISLDYVVNRRRARRDREKEFESITVTGNAIGDFIRADLGESVTHSAWGQEYDGGVWQAQLLTGVVGLLAGGTMALRGYDVFYPEVRDPGAGIVALPRDPGVVGWGLYQAAELAQDFGNIAQGVYGMLRPRLTSVLRALTDMLPGQRRVLTEQEVADRVAEVFPEADDIELNQVLQERADEIMRGRADARLIVPPGSDIDDLLGDLPGVPQVGVEPGRIMLMRRDDGSEGYCLAIEGHLSQNGGSGSASHPVDTPLRRHRLPPWPPLPQRVADLAAFCFCPTLDPYILRFS